MKLPYLSLLLLLTLNSKGQNQNIKKFNYAFENDGKIYVNSESEKKTYLIAKGSDPYLSPDGKKIAYTDYFGSDGRRIAILDLNSKIKDTLNIHNNNYYGPVWSPDGNYIAFNLFEGNNWIIKIIDKNYNQITTIGTSNHSYYSPSWTTNSKNLIMQDLDSIYFFSLDGRLKSKYNLREVTDGHGNSSSTNFQITPDNKYLLFNGDSDDPSTGDGPS
jgi:hypothetical protein